MTQEQFKTIGETRIFVAQCAAKNAMSNERGAKAHESAVFNMWALSHSEKDHMAYNRAQEKTIDAVRANERAQAQLARIEHEIFIGEMQYHWNKVFSS